MEDVEFSDGFCRFIQTTIPAVDAAELLLFFHGKSDSRWSAQEAVAKLGPGISTSDALKYLELFKSRGLVASVDGRFQYRSDSEHAAHVAILAQAYAQRPVTLVRVIYALRDRKIQNFADAFKIRRS